MKQSKYSKTPGCAFKTYKSEYDSSRSQFSFQPARQIKPSQIDQSHSEAFLNENFPSFIGKQFDDENKIRSMIFFEI